MRKLLLERIHRADDGVDYFLKHQITDKNSPYHGAVINENTGFTEPAHGAHYAAFIMSKYSLTWSKYYNDESILIKGIYGIQFTLRKMHADNTYDMTSTNPHDPTSVAFAVRAVVPYFRQYKKHIESKDQISEQEAALYNYIMEFFYKAVDGIVGNGFHTPNHRWVVASALAQLKNLLDMPELMDEINSFLDEGIDCDEHGEYAERSIAIYNLTNNESFMIIAFELDKPEFLEYIRKNLYMTTKYFEPDGTLFTLNSTRQDFGSSTYPIAHFDFYAAMAYIQNNTDFAYLAQYIYNMNSNSIYDIGPLGYHAYTMAFLNYMEYIDYFNNDVEAVAFDFTSFDSFFPNSNIARIREKDTSLSILSQHNIFMKFMTRFSSVHMKFLTDEYISFDTIEKTQSGYTLKNSKGIVDIAMHFVFNKDEVEITVEADSEFEYPCTAVLLFNSPGMIKADSYSFDTRMGKSMLDNTGDFVYHYHKMGLYNTLHFTHDFSQDSNNMQDILEKTLPLDNNAFTMFLSDNAPFKKSIRIKGV